MNTPVIAFTNQFAYFGKPFVFLLTGMGLKPDDGTVCLVTIVADNAKWQPATLSDQDDPPSIQFADDGTSAHFVSTPIFAGNDGNATVNVTLLYRDEAGDEVTRQVTMPFVFVSA